MVDASTPERLEESRTALERVRAFVWLLVGLAAHVCRPARPQALACRELDGAPLLLLANKKDCYGSDALLAVEKAFGKLCEARAERAARIQPCCALNGEGLRDGLAWAVDAARKARRTRVLMEAAAASAS